MRAPPPAPLRAARAFAAACRRRGPALLALLCLAALLAGAAPAHASSVQPDVAAEEGSDGVGSVLSSETRDYVILGTLVLAALAAGLADARTRRRGGGGRALAVAREEAASRARQVAELREELARTRVRLDEATRASESKTRFIGHVSHEFRTPLSSIIGFASLLSAEHARLPDATRGEYLEIVLRNSRHLLHVINDILNLSKVEAGTLEVTPAPVYVPEAVAAVVASLGPLAEEQGIRVHTVGEAGHFAVADSGRLRQVVQNLLENALKYAPAGSAVRVEVSSDGGEVRIDVRDEGPGISEADQGRLFKEFSRINLPGVRVAGAGLGLALSKQLVELMGGRIGVRSEPGRGSDFWIALPAGEEIGARVPPPTAPDPAAPGARRGIVAVVDDDPDIRAFAAVILERAGYTVLLDDGREGAAQRLCGGSPDVVLLDLHLEGRGGYEALAELRGCAPLHGVPVIAFTASGTPAELARMRAARFDGQLLKPVEPDTLLRCVDGAITASARRHAAPPEADEPTGTGEDEDDYLAPLRARFRAGLPSRLAEMEAARDAADRDTLTREAHKLRGAAAGYGMEPLSAAAGRAEEALRSGAPVHAAEVEAMLAMVRAAAPERMGA